MYKRQVLESSDSLKIVAELGADNSSDFIVAVREVSGEFFSFSVPASVFTVGEFTEYKLELGSPVFVGDTSGTGLSDGVLNDAIQEVSFQSPFGGSGTIDVVVQSIAQHVVIPEPTTIALLGFAGLATATMRRR